MSLSVPWIALIWMAATLTVIRAASTLARRLDPEPGPFVVVHTVVIAWTGLVAVAALLSLGSMLSGVTLVLGVTLVASLALLGSTFTFRPNSAPGSVASRRPVAVWIKAAWFIQLAFWSGHVVSGGLLEFATDWDSLMYHLPLVDYWLQARSLLAPRSGHWSNPGGNELLGLWSVCLFPNDALMMLANIPATLLLSIGALEIGKRFGLPPMLRHPMALAVASNFVVMKQLTDAENDVAVAGLFLVTLAYGFRASASGAGADLWLGAMSLGLLAGIKFYALGYAGVAWASIALLTALRRGLRAGIRLAAVWVIVATVVGGYWYGRNAIVTGSPFFPLAKAPGAASLTMDYPTPWRTTFLGNHDPEVWPLAAEAVWKMTGPFSLSAAYAFPIVVAWLLAVALRSRGRAGGSAPERLTLSLAMIGSAAVLAVTPMALEDVPGTLNHLRWFYTPVRYGLAALSLAPIGLVVVLHDVCMLRLARPRSSAFEAPERSAFTRCMAPLLCALLGCSALFQLAHLEKGCEVDWLSSGLIGLDLGLLYLLAVQLRGRLRSWTRRLATAALAGSLAAGAAIAIGILSRSWDEQFVSFYEERFSTSVLSRLLAQDASPKRVSYYDYQCYPLFGPNRQVQLSQQRRVVDYEAMREFLKTNRTSYVIVDASGRVRGWDNYGQVRRWLEERRDEFALVLEDWTYSVYEVLPPRRERPGSPPGSGPLPPPGPG